MEKWYEKVSNKLDQKGLWFIVWTTVAILIGGLVEIPPFFMQGTIKKIDSVTPYNSIELAGRDVYQAEGCVNCHTQMIRPFKWETDRWDPKKEFGSEPYSKAGEYVYDHPFLFGSKRTGPDLAHESSLNNNVAWHKKHLVNPQETSPGSIMPAYAFLFENKLDIKTMKARMRALQKIGVPYTDAEIEESESHRGKTEGDALIAYLLKLGKDTKQ